MIGETEREGEKEREEERRWVSVKMQQTRGAEWFEVESLVNLKRNLRSVIPAYGFTPIGAGEGGGNFCALVRGKEGKKDAQPFDGSARGS